MKSEQIPDFLIEMSKQLNTQDNRLTADPLFEVRYKNYLVTESGYSEHHWEIIDDEGQTLFHSIDGDFNLLSEHLIEFHEDWCSAWLIENDIEIELDVDKFSEALFDHFDFDYDDLPSDLKKLHMQEVEITVNSHFTEAGARAFIKRKQHDYPKLYTYATSLCYCPQMIELRGWIKGLSND